MIVTVGSMNPVKIRAVESALAAHESFYAVKVIGITVLSGVSPQPTSLEETVRGAVNRAEKAFQNCEYSVGLEDGLFAVPYTPTGFMNVCACAISDGQQVHLGLSSAFSYPPDVLRYVFKEKMEVGQAFHKAGLTTNPALGSAEGAIGVLTKGKLSRKEYTKQAVLMALVSVENSFFHIQK